MSNDSKRFCVLLIEGIQPHEILRIVQNIADWILSSDPNITAEVTEEDCHAFLAVPVLSGLEIDWHPSEFSEFSRDYFRPFIKFAALRLPGPFEMKLLTKELGTMVDSDCSDSDIVSKLKEITNQVAKFVECRRLFNDGKKCQKDDNCAEDEAISVGYRVLPYETCVNASKHLRSGMHLPS